MEASRTRSVMYMYGIGIGQSDFKALRIRKNYYIDKTMYIKDIIDNEASVLLVTRPRRFGKTLNMSMLKYYFDCTKKDSKELFEGLKIMEQEEKYTSKLGYYPCIYLTLKTSISPLAAPTWKRSTLEKSVVPNAAATSS